MQHGGHTVSLNACDDNNTGAFGHAVHGDVAVGIEDVVLLILGKHFVGGVLVDDVERKHLVMGQEATVCTHVVHVNCGFFCASDGDRHGRSLIDAVTGGTLHTVTGDTVDIHIEH